MSTAPEIRWFRPGEWARCWCLRRRTIEKRKAELGLVGAHYYPMWRCSVRKVTIGWIVELEVPEP